jgi:hypothetical protein
MTAFKNRHHRSGKSGVTQNHPPRPFATVVVKGSFGVTRNYGLPSVLCPGVATCRICRRRHEAADLSREQPGEFDCRRVFTLWPDDLQGDR